jgi:nucleoside-diphosphate-sugar epimerase
MKILVTGTEGYIGSLLAPFLLQRGHDVVGIDTGFYKVGWLYNGTNLTARTLNKDIRRVIGSDLEGIEAVVHLAELSNDPAGELNPEVTFEINHRGSVQLASLAKSCGVRRFVYTSSCSVYGVAAAAEVTEESRANPQTAYAVCKTLVERDVAELADKDFSPTFLRNATAYGASPRMRFDIVLNNLSGLAWTTREIKMTSDGTPWRPLVHVLDICQAVACTLEAPRESIHNQIFNVGDTGANYRVREIADIVAETFENCRLSFGANDSDNRSYRVSFEKINTLLPNFNCSWTVREGAQQLHKLFSQVALSDEAFRFRGFTRLKQLEHLLQTKQLDEKFFWREEYANVIPKMPVQRQAAATYLC